PAGDERNDGSVHPPDLVLYDAPCTTAANGVSRDAGHVTSHPTATTPGANNQPDCRPYRSGKWLLTMNSTIATASAALWRSRTAAPPAPGVAEGGRGPGASRRRSTGQMRPEALATTIVPSIAPRWMNTARPVMIRSSADAVAANSASDTTMAV